MIWRVLWNLGNALARGQLRRQWREGGVRLIGAIKSLRVSHSRATARRLVIVRSYF